MAIGPVRHKEPIMGCLTGRIGKPIREALASTCGGLFVYNRSDQYYPNKHQYHMGILSNFKIDSLRKKIENGYDLKIEKFILNLKNLPEDRRREVSDGGRMTLRAIEFAKIMNFSLFQPDLGIFVNDADKLDEYNFSQLYQIMIIWYTWAIISLDSSGEKNKEGIDFCIDSLETSIGISPSTTKVYYDGLANMNAGLSPFALYRWSMLTIGHIDIYYETMHENSPDCIKFIATAHFSFLESEKSFNHPS
jgi:hypothetical protein